MKKGDYSVDVDVNKEGDVEVTISKEAQEKIPRVGDKIFVIDSYLADDDADSDPELDTPKTKPIMAYSYTKVRVKATLLNDEADEVVVNGDYRIPLYKDTVENNRRLLVYNSEEKAMDRWVTLMSASLKEAERRTKRAQAIEDYVATAMKKLHH